MVSLKKTYTHQVSRRFANPLTAYRVRAGYVRRGEKVSNLRMDGHMIVFTVLY